MRMPMRCRVLLIVLTGFFLFFWGASEARAESAPSAVFGVATVCAGAHTESSPELRAASSSEDEPNRTDLREASDDEDGEDEDGRNAPELDGLEGLVLTNPDLELPPGAPSDLAVRRCTDAGPTLEHRLRLGRPPNR